MFDELVEIICNYVDVQPADVHEESRFMEDLAVSYTHLCIKQTVSLNFVY